MKIEVTRNFHPIKVYIDSCDGCPWLQSENDGQMTLHVCMHPVYPGRGYDRVIPGYDRHQLPPIKAFPPLCPFLVSQDNWDTY
jgi:hypothetical protein